MVDVNTEIRIKIPIEDVANYAMNPLNAPEWYVNIKSAEIVEKANTAHKGDFELGDKIAFRAQFLGKELKYIYEIVELVNSKRMVMRTADGPFPMETTYTFEKVDKGSTLMKLRNKGEPSGFSKFVSPFMSYMMKKANRKDLQKVKNILEINRD